MKLKISKRLEHMQDSPIRKLVKYADETKKHGTKVYHLNIGQPDIDSPEVVTKAIRNLDLKILSYSPYQGEWSYIQTLVNYYRNMVGIKEINEDNILVTMGGSEAILFSFFTITDPGDEIIVFQPFYTNYNGFATIGNVNLIPVTCKAKDGFHLPDRKLIEERITSRTKAFLICSPNNPTGTVLTHEEIQMLGDLAKKYNLFIISDEAYREFIYDGEKHTSILHFPDLRDRAILVDSTSKRFSLCGARIGNLVSFNKDVMKLAGKFAQARLCAPQIEQLIIRETEKLGDEYYSSIIREYQKRRDIVMKYLHSRDDILALTPKGAFYVVAKLPISDCEHFAKWLLTDFSHENSTVMVSPAAGFYATPGAGMDEVRIAYVLKDQDLTKAMEVFLVALDKYVKEFETGERPLSAEQEI